MKVQQVQMGNQKTWTVLGDNYLPVRPIQEFLDYMENCERSPNTVRSYAYHLRLYWEFLTETSREWTNVGISDLAQFIEWLRIPTSQVIPLAQKAFEGNMKVAKRTETTVNAIMTSVGRFYDFQEDLGVVENIPLYKYKRQPKQFKDFLYHINKGKPSRVKELKLKEPKRIPKTLTGSQVRQLIDACHRLRDKFLISLMYESGIRIGQALGMRHGDVKSFDHLIWVIPREDNSNGARAKRKDPLSLDVTKDLMELYNAYVLEEFEECESDYVFVNLWEGNIGKPMTYRTVAELFKRLSKKTGFKAHPHQLRHSHGTNLIREGWDASYVQKRLGHAHVQTTINTYVHLNDEDMKKAYKEYLGKIGQDETDTDPVD